MSALQRTVSPARLSPYKEAAGFDQQRAVHLYLWNVAAGQSFHFPLQVTEVALRNAIGDVVEYEFGQKWWRESKAQTFLDGVALDDLAKA